VRDLDLFRQVLDHTVIDADGMPCGRVDDIIADCTATQARVTSLLVGPGAFAHRLPPLPALVASRLFGRRIVRVPWSEVAEVGEFIRLRSKAVDLGLGRIDRRLGAWLGHWPGAGSEA